MSEDEAETRAGVHSASPLSIAGIEGQYGSSHSFGTAEQSVHSEVLPLVYADRIKATRIPRCLEGVPAISRHLKRVTGRRLVGQVHLQSSRPWIWTVDMIDIFGQNPKGIASQRKNLAKTSKS